MWANTFLSPYLHPISNVLNGKLRKSPHQCGVHIGLYTLSSRRGLHMGCRIMKGVSEQCIARLLLTLDKERFDMERQREERKRMKEEWEQKKEEPKRLEKQENQQCTHINKAIEKISRFDGTNPSYCFDWLEQTEVLVNEHQGRVYREELLLNCSTSVAKTIHTLPQEATNQQIKDAILQNHSNLRTVSQCFNAYQQLHQKPDEALQTYNTRHTSYFNLTYPKLEVDNPLSRMHCIHYASSLYGKLGDEMTGRFNQDLPGQEKIEINETHIQNPNYKGKNYDPNYQQNKNKQLQQ